MSVYRWRCRPRTNYVTQNQWINSVNEGHKLWARRKAPRVHQQTSKNRSFLPFLSWFASDLFLSLYLSLSLSITLTIYLPARQQNVAISPYRHSYLLHARLCPSPICFQRSSSLFPAALVWPVCVCVCVWGIAGRTGLSASGMIFIEQ